MNVKKLSIGTAIGLSLLVSQVFAGQIYNPPNNMPVLVVPRATTTDINNAVVAIHASGGGTVQLLPIVYRYTGIITPLAGVTIQGAPPSWSFTGEVPAASWQFVSGSEILGTGVETIIQGNKNSTSTAPSLANFAAAAIGSFGLKDIVFSNVLNAWDIGDTNYVGLYNAHFERIWLLNSGANLVNFQQSVFKDIYARADVSVFTSGRQVRYASDVPTATFIPADSIFQNMSSQTGGVYQGGIVFEATAGSGLNNLDLHKFQAARYDSGIFNNTNTVLTASSTSIGVANSGLWPVGMPVWFTASVGGFTANYAYFVVSSAANIITIAAYPGGTAVASTATDSTHTLASGGFAAVSFIGDPGTTSGYITTTYASLQAEESGAPAVVASNATGFSLELTDTLASTGQSHVIFRNCTSCKLDSVSVNPIITDFENGSAKTYVTGMRGTIVNRTGWGNWNGHTSGTPGTSILVNPNSGALGAGAGGTAALSYGNDGSAVITIVTAGVPVAGTVATVSFGTPKEYGFMSLIPLNAAANALQISTNSLRMQYPPRNTGFDLINDGLGLATGTTYIFGFQSK